MREVDNLTTFMCRMLWKSGSQNLLEPSGPHWACYGIPLCFFLTAGPSWCLASNQSNTHLAVSIDHMNIFQFQFIFHSLDPPVGFETCQYRIKVTNIIHDVQNFRIHLISDYNIIAEKVILAVVYNIIFKIVYDKIQ